MKFSEFMNIFIEKQILMSEYDRAASLFLSQLSPTPHSIALVRRQLSLLLLGDSELSSQSAGESIAATTSPIPTGGGLTTAAPSAVEKSHMAEFGCALISSKTAMTLPIIATPEVLGAYNHPHLPPISSAFHGILLIFCLPSFLASALWAQLGSPEHMIMVFSVSPTYRSFLPHFAPIVLTLIRALPQQLHHEIECSSSATLLSESESKISEPSIPDSSVKLCTRLNTLLQQLLTEITIYESNMQPLPGSAQAPSPLSSPTSTLTKRRNGSISVATSSKKKSKKSGSDDVTQGTRSTRKHYNVCFFGAHI
jgi:hypothetical protein